MPPFKFWLNPTSVQERTLFEDFQHGHHGGHFEYRNGTILAIPNLYVAPMPPIKLLLNQTYGLGGYTI